MEFRTVRRRTAVLVALLVALLLVPAALSAGHKGSAAFGYGGKGGNVQAGLQGGVNAAPVHGTLPFTGVDLAFGLLAGAALLGIGLGVRRLGRSS